jgi:3-(3-hydroxy-phenyl)propionate hydroxylase
LEGTLSPQPKVRLLGGAHARFDDVTGAGFALVGLGCDPRRNLTLTSRTTLAQLNTTYVALYADGQRPQGPNEARDPCSDLAEVEDMHGILMAWFGRAGHRARSVAILRPDKFIYAVTRIESLGDVLKRLDADLLGGLAQHAQPSAVTNVGAAPETMRGRPRRRSPRFSSPFGRRVAQTVAGKQPTSASPPP